VSDLTRLQMLARGGDVEAALACVREHVRRGSLTRPIFEDLCSATTQEQTDSISQFTARLLLDAGECPVWGVLDSDPQNAHRFDLRELSYKDIPLNPIRSTPFDTAKHPVSAVFFRYNPTPESSFYVELPWTVYQMRLWLCDCFETRVSLTCDLDNKIRENYDGSYTMPTDIVELPDTSCIELLHGRLKEIRSSWVTGSQPHRAETLMAEARIRARKNSVNRRDQNFSIIPIVQIFERIIGGVTSPVLVPELLPRTTLPMMLSVLVGKRPGVSAFGMTPADHKVRANIHGTFSKIMLEYLIGKREATPIYG